MSTLVHTCRQTSNSGLPACQCLLMVLCVRPPLLVRRPVLGPLLGGFLTSAFGWRSTFAALAAAAAVLGALIAVAFPETQQCMALRRFAAQHGDDAMNRIEEAPEILAAPPALQPFWQPLGCVLWGVVVAPSALKHIRVIMLWCSLACAH
jgi:MFS family permease